MECLVREPLSTAIAILLLCLFTHTSASAQNPGLPVPYWAQNTEVVLAERQLEAGKTLAGRSFLFLPNLVGPEPVDDWRILLTFTSSTLVDISLSGPKVYPIVYGDGCFMMDTSLWGPADARAGLIMGALGLTSQTKYGLVNIHDGRLGLVALAPEGVREPGYRVLGRIREIDNDEREKLALYMIEQANIVAVSTAVAAATGEPLSYITMHDCPGGWRLEALYYGQCDSAFAKKFRGGTVAEEAVERIARQQLLRFFYRYYHIEYGKRFFDSQKDLSEQWVDVNVDERSYKIRRRFAATFEAAGQVHGANALVQVAMAVDPSTLKLDTEKLFAIELVLATRLFLDRYSAVSPATIDRFEENLERALRDRVPKGMNRPAPVRSWRSLRLPWEILPTPIRAEHRGMTWVPPPLWKPVDRKYGSVVYQTGDAFAESEVIIQLVKPAVQDVLQLINSWRFKDRAQPVATLAEANLEATQVDGLDVQMAFLTLANHAIIHDGERTWTVTQYGSAPHLIESLRKEFREFVSSWRVDRTFDRTTDIEDPDRSRRGPRPDSGGGSRRRGPP